MIREVLSVILVTLFAMAGVGCSIEDDRDECCETNSVRFRYLYNGVDHFSEYIHTIRYLLFDSDGNYLYDMEGEQDEISRVKVDTLPYGDYTIIAIGNLHDYGSVYGHDLNLNQLRLAVEKYHPDRMTHFASGERIYWGECPIKISQNSTNRYVGEMANVHCLLRVKFEWEGANEYPDGYSYRLTGIGTGMEMHGGNAPSIGVQKFPPVETYKGALHHDASMLYHILDATMVSLRWTSDDIPSLGVWHGDEPVSGEIDLKSIFRQWGWNPENAPVQEYGIRLLLRLDGMIEVRQGIDASVLDWEDGGTFG